MASAKLVIPQQAGGPLLLSPEGIITLPQFVGGGGEGFRSQYYGNTTTPVEGATIVPTSASHANAGYTAQLIAPTGGGAGVANLDVLAIPTWTAGQSYVQWAVVFDPNGLGSKAYVKFTAGTLAPNTTAPSSDAVNWRLTETPGTSAPSLITGNYVTRGIWNSQSIRGDQPASVELLRDGTGGTATAVLTGRSADGTTIPDGKLRVEGEVNCEFIRITNTIHAANPTIGSGSIAVGSSSVTINTTASDINAKIFITQTSCPDAPGGVVAVVTSKTANNFVVSAFNTTNEVGPPVVNPGIQNVGGTIPLTFDWVIFNPVF